MNASIIQRTGAVVCPLGEDRHIIRTEFRLNCFIYQSFRKEESRFGDIDVRAHVSFLADSGNGKAAEWEPQYGPIQVWTQCDEDWTGEAEMGTAIKSRSHWHFQFVEDRPFCWSQLAVDREGLKEKLVSGDIHGVFDVLMRWADY